MRLPPLLSLAQPQIRALVSRVPMPNENLAGRTIAGYRLLERVGEGGTAEVYRAQHPGRGPCAFKVLRSRLASDPTAVKRFLREAGYGSRVEHPGVVRTYDYGEADGLYYLALEWAEGKSLAEYVHRAGPLAPTRVVSIVRQLADALAAAHQAGIIHRDLKPENITYDPESQRVKLLDFGIARDAELPPEERLTRTGFFVGTLKYVAPEALSGELVDGWADIYSLATIAYWMLTGQHPHSGRTPRELFQQLLTKDPTPLSEVVPGLRFPPGLEAAVMQGLERDPGRRPPTVTAFAANVTAAPAAARAQGMPLDAFSVRKQAKAHGTGKRIEGCFRPGAAVVVVEDVITTGHSAAEAIAAVTAEGGRVLGVLAVVDREEGGRTTLEQAGHPVEALVTATDFGLR